MPVQTSDVRAGDPSVQASGHYRGTVDVTLTDGRVYALRINAADLDEWNDKVAAAGSTVEALFQESDAAAAVSADGEVVSNKEASIQQVAVAYLRAAWETENAYDAYLLFSRFNTYRLNNGWTLDQVQANLAAAGLSAEEWTNMRTAYQYLNGGGRPAIMADAKTIQDNWEARE